MRSGKIGIATLGFVWLTTGAAFAQDWTHWRGPNYNGSTTATNLPTRFSPTEGVKWSVALPGSGAATPIIWGENVFVSSIDPKAQQLLALCLDRKTGKIKWQQSAGSGYQPAGEGEKVRLENRSNYASPSPVTDGKRVVFFYGNGDLVSFDLKGNRQWARNLQKEYGDFCFMWTFGSSPTLYEGKLYLQILQRDQAVGNRGKDKSPSFLLALDPATGKEIWKHIRPSPAKMESLESYGTPIPHEHNGRKEILIAGGDVLTGHDPATGKELWRWGTWNPGHREMWWRLVPSPVAGGGVALACGPKRAPVFAVKTGRTGELSQSELAWRSEDRSPVTTDVPTPLYYKNRFYVLSDLRRTLSCVEPATGNVVWATPLPGSTMYWGSPTGADNKVYVLNTSGEVSVLDATSGAILATNPMATNDDEVRASIAVAHGNLFIRTSTRLYCVGR